MSYSKLLLLAVLTAIMVSCSGSGSDSNSGESPQVLAITSSVQINLANKGTFTLGGTCSIEGAEITVTLESFTPLTTNCVNFVWEVSVIERIVDQIAEGSPVATSVVEAGNDTPATTQVQKDITAPIVGTGSFTPAVINSVNQGSYTLQGSCSEKGVVIVTVGDLQSKTTKCNNGNAWSINFDLSALDTSPVNIGLSMVDEGGNVSSAKTLSVIRDVEVPEVTITTTATEAAIISANVGGLNLAGSCQGSTQVAVTIGSLSKENVNCVSGDWQLLGKDVRALAEGNVSIVVRQEDEYGNHGDATLSVVKDVTPPALEVTSSTLTINIANKDSYQGVRGTCEGSQRVMVVMGSAQAQGVVCTGSAWSFAINSALAEGAHALTLTQADERGNTTTRNFTLVRDITAPTLTLASNLTIDAGNEAQFFLSGSCGEVGTIIVTVATLPPVTATCDGSNWTTASALDTTDLDDGQVSVTATMVDAVGNSGTSQTSITKDTMTRAIAIGALKVIDAKNKATYTVSGTCSPHPGNVTVTLVSGQTVTQTLACESRTWQTGAFNVSSLTDGNVVVSATFGAGADQVQAAGKTVIKDTVVPTITITDNLSAINLANQGSYTVSGTCDDNSATVTVSVGGLAARTATCNGTVWGLSDYDATAVTASTASLTASIADQSGNSRTATAVTVKRDIALPVVTITSANVHINALNKANYSLAGSCEAGLALSLTIGTLGPETLTCGADSAWSLASFDTSSLAEGTNYHLVAVQTDAAGNVGRVTQAFDKDITAPTVAITSVRQVNRINENRFTIGGSCSDSGEKVGVTIASEAAVEVDCTSLSWIYQNIDLSNATTYPEGSAIAVSITHRDKVGNAMTVSDATTQLSKDVTAPTVSIDTLSEVSGTTDLTSYAVSGNCSEASVVVVVDASGVAPSAQPTCGAASVGRWSATIDISALSGVVSFIAQQTDAVGNVGRAAEQTVALGEMRLSFQRQILTLGIGYGCAVTNDKKVQCWGSNIKGQLGDNTTTKRAYPAYVVDGDGSSDHLTGIVEVAAGSNHVCALKSNGKVLCWGEGENGRLGHGGTADKDHPVYVKANSSTDLTGMVQITAGSNYTCALKENGQVLCWGNDGYGQLGNGGTATDAQLYPVSVHQSESSSNPLTGIVQVQAGGNYTCALSSAGRAYCWGYGANGQLGSSDKTIYIANDGDYSGVNRHAPLLVLTAKGGVPLSRIREISPGGATHSCALLEGGGVKCWGGDYLGRLGNGESGGQYFPVDVLAGPGSSNNLSGITRLAAARQGHCGLSSSGGVKCWGAGNLGQLGNGANHHQSRPVDVILGRGQSTALGGVIDLARGAQVSFSCAQHQEGRLLCWGKNDKGALGNGLGVDENFGRSLFNYPTVVIDGEGSTGALMTVSTFRGTYTCVGGDGRCSADPVELKIAGDPVGMSNAVTIEVSGLTAAQTLTLYDDSACASLVGTLAGNAAVQQISLSSLAEGAYKFRFKVAEGAEVTSCSQNFITYVYDNTAPTALALAVPSASGTATSTTITVSNIMPSYLVKLYRGSDCSAANSSLEATIRSHGYSETITLEELSTGAHVFRAQATDAAGNTSTCQAAGVSYTITGPPAVAIGSLEAINSENQVAYTVSGTCSSHPGNVTVSLVGGQTVTQTLACIREAWQTGAFNVSSLTDGNVVVSATFGAGADQVQAAEKTVIKDIVAPAITIASNLSAINLANQGGYTVSGTCNDNSATVTVSVGGLAARTATCNGSVWSLSDYDATAVTASTASLTVSIADQSGNSRTATAVTVKRDIVLPVVTITSTNVHINALNKANYSLAGTCEEGLALSLTIGTLGPQTLTCGADSAWSLASFDTSSLAEGMNYNLVAVQTDAAGNVGRVTQAFDKDITAPTVAITSVRQVNQANQSRFTMGGSCSDSGEKVGVTIASEAAVEVDCTALSWIYQNIDLSNATTYPEGSAIVVSITHRDKVGNAVTVSDATTQLSKDVTIPTVTLDALSEVGGTTDLTSYAVSGNCSEASVVVVVNAAEVAPTTQPTCGAASTGRWSVTIDISALSGVVSFTAQQTDAAGNVGRAAEQTIALGEMRLSFQRQILTLGGGYGCAVTKDKKVQCWGSNIKGQLGDNTTTSRGHPAYVVDGDGSSDHLTGIVEVVTADDHTCALENDGKVLCWGKGADGQLGHGGTADKDHPVYVKANNSTDLTGMVQITAGSAHTCGLKENGQVLCWGGDDFGQLGNGGTVTDDQLYPVSVHQSESSSNPLTGIAQVQAGGNYTCALSVAGWAYCWGHEASGQLGSSDETIYVLDDEYVGVNRHAPRLVLTVKGGFR